MFTPHLQRCRPRTCAPSARCLPAGRCRRPWRTRLRSHKCGSVDPRVCDTAVHAGKVRYPISVSTAPCPFSTPLVAPSFGLALLACAFCPLPPPKPQLLPTTSPSPSLATRCGTAPPPFQIPTKLCLPPLPPRPVSCDQLHPSSLVRCGLASPPFQATTPPHKTLATLTHHQLQPASL